MSVPVLNTSGAGIYSESDIESVQSAAWLEGMNHVLSWLALRQFSETMAKDNPYGRAE